jgi:hypothetical protein
MEKVIGLNKKILFVVGIFSFVFSINALAQFSINAPSTNYTENFNALTSGTWTDNTTATGWYAKTDLTSPITTYGANTGTTTTAGLYAFGVAGTNPLTDRALGYAPSNAYTGASGTGKGYVGWRLLNNTGGSLSSITVTWTGEQWRKDATVSQTLNLYYQQAATVTNLTAGTWTSAPSSFSSPINTAGAAALDGNAAANRSANISVTITVNIPAGEEIMLRWEDLNDAGTDHFMAIDDITINATSGTTPTITLSTTTLTGFTYPFGSGPSAEQTFTCSGTNLTTDITLTPPTDYEISLSSGSGFVASPSTLTLTQSAGTVAATTIYVRLKAGLAVANYNAELITASSTGATNKTVSCSGNVSGPVITVTPTTLTTFNYVVGNGPSSELTFNVSGVGLSADIILTPPTNYEISLTSGSGFVTSPSTIALTPSATNTVATTTIYVRLKAGLAIGSYNAELITASSTGATNKTVSCSGTVTVSSASDVVPVTSSEAASVPPNINTAGPLLISDGTQVWQFTIRDGGASSDLDNLPTIVTGITIANLNSAGLDWSTAINSIDLFNGSINVGSLQFGSANLTASQAQFTGITGITVPDNSSLTISVRLTLRCPLGAGNVEGDYFRLSISNGNFTTASSATSSQKNSSFPAAQSTATSTFNDIDVIATQLIFSTQPSSTGVGVGMSPSVTVIATDACGNIDLGVNSTITITSTGSMSGAPITVTASSGVATYTSVVHSAVGTGLTLTASASGFSNITSNLFNISLATALKPGDLVYVGFNANTAGSNDDIYIMNMVDIVPGTSFSHVNSRFEAGAAACTRTLRWAGPGNDPNQDPGSITLNYNGGSNIGAGSIIMFNTGISGSNSTITQVLINGVDRTSDFSYTSSGVANISVSDGDQLWLVQGSFSNLGTTNVQLTGQVLYGLTTGVNWVAFSSAVSNSNASGTARQSRLHPDLECFNFQASAQLYTAYYKTTSVHTGSKRTLLGNIATVGNWTTSTSSASTVPASIATTTFTVSSSNPNGTWVGDAASNSNDWFTCGNWEGLTVPDRDMDVVIPNVTNFARIDVDGYAVGSCSGTYTSDKYKVNGVRLAECKTLTVDGETLEFGNGSSNSGDVNDRLDIYGSLTINNTVGSNLDMDAGTSLQDGTINLQGDWINNMTAAAFAEGNGTINFVETINQFVTTASFAEEFSNIGINKTGGSVTLNNPADVVTNAAFTQGLINTTATNLLTFKNNATTTGATNLSFVNGPTRKTGDDAFTFPIGKNTSYAPASITAPSLTTDHFTAEYFGTDPQPSYDRTLKDPTLTNISACEYWIIDRTNGASNVTVGLSWNTPRSCGVGSLPDLMVARWNGLMWKDHGNGGTTGTTTTGTIATSAAVTSFSPFTLASVSLVNPLPIELLTFTAIPKNKQVELNWQTATEINNDFFTIERSATGENFSPIAIIDGAGNSNSILNYVDFDNAPLSGVSYYRLKQTDFDGNYSYSSVVSVNFITNDFIVESIYPNPSQNDLNIQFNTIPSNAIISIYNTLGECILNQTSNSISIKINTSSFANGVYFISIRNGETVFQEKFIKQ